MHKFSKQRFLKEQAKLHPVELSDAEIYSEEAVWLCENLKTNYKTRIHGALAQILKKYPQDYNLRLLFTKEPCYEQPAATGE
jgi:hypothetical protein